MKAGLKSESVGWKKDGTGLVEKRRSTLFDVGRKAKGVILTGKGSRPVRTPRGFTAVCSRVPRDKEGRAKKTSAGGLTDEEKNGGTRTPDSEALVFFLRALYVNYRSTSRRSAHGFHDRGRRVCPLG